MRSYVRPEVVDRAFHDTAGRVIGYGNRWGGESPPEDTYSVVSHPERFAPVGVVADALIAHLSAAYLVDVADDLSLGDHRPGDDVTRVVRLTPAATAAATLIFAFAGDKGFVRVGAGLLHDFPFPGCSCDACDETWQSAAEGLETLVLAVVAGRFGERVTRGPRPWIHYALADESGEVTSSGSRAVLQVPPERLRTARRVLDQLAGPWRPWPPR